MVREIITGRYLQSTVVHLNRRIEVRSRAHARLPLIVVTNNVMSKIVCREDRGDLRAWNKLDRWLERGV